MPPRSQSGVMPPQSKAQRRGALQSASRVVSRQPLVQKCEV